MTRREHFMGLLMGAAVGDSIGLPAEGLSKEQIRRRWKGVWQQRLLFRHGLVSDDTEHTWMVADCLAQSSGDVERFRQLWSWKLRLWFAALPPGIGLATARACLKLWAGVSPQRAGVHSAGNGPAMRSAVIGACFRDHPDKLDAFVRASTVMTHTDERALCGALAVARCAALACSQKDDQDHTAIFRALSECGGHRDWRELVRRLKEGLAAQSSVEELALAIGCARGVSGYVFHSVPVAIYAWLRHGADFQRAIEEVGNCGGDTDTVAAIAGSLVGAGAGGDGIPLEWRRRLLFWPGSQSRIARLADALVADGGVPAQGPPWIGQLLKNLLMLVVVLAHGLRRLVWP